MSQVTINIPFDEERLKALDFSLKKENTSAQKRMEQALAELYEKAVPEPLREYVDSKSAPAAKPRHPAKSEQPKSVPPAKTGAPISMPVKEVEKNG
jgi:hypothetical protein